ncbi:hypothetical protein [Streptomyces yangpuensis]|uniref:hypothetical protein n=1 Tax=Streptomyces yangpuensis TaxID=1648182 RepID=UPI0012FF011D|nr:hypothetical protein [Streptomyces yangpuensis]
MSARSFRSSAGLVPGATRADDPAPNAHGVSVPDADLGQAATAPNAGTFTSAAERTVRPAGKANSGGHVTV